MGIWGSSWDWARMRLVVAGLLMATCLVGCGRKGRAQKQLTGAEEATQEGSAGGGKSGDPRMHQPMHEAAHLEPPTDSPSFSRPPDTTMTGKATGKLFADVQRLWDTIRFTTGDGQPITYTAVLETDLGNIEIALRPDWAPNHVRNFIALARAGYYDGLVFDGAVHDEFVDDEGNKITVDYLEAGGPGGVTEPEHSSIGYWMKPEFRADVPHEEGTVGAAHGYERDSAACKFYITLCKAPMLDGAYTVFGKVTRGLDVAREIFKQPVRRDDKDPEQDFRPLKPVVIRKVTIHASGG